MPPTCACSPGSQRGARSPLGHPGPRRSRCRGLGIWNAPSRGSATGAAVHGLLRRGGLVHLIFHPFHSFLRTDGKQDSVFSKRSTRYLSITLFCKGLVPGSQGAWFSAPEQPQTLDFPFALTPHGRQRLLREAFWSLSAHGSCDNVEYTVPNNELLPSMPNEFFTV